jgi:hypothetical protein
MKITSLQYSQILESIRPLVPKLQAYRELITKNPRAGSSPRQVRLDVFYAADGPSKLFPYCNYAALDSSVVRAMNELGFPEFSK